MSEPQSKLQRFFQDQPDKVEENKVVAFSLKRIMAFSIDYTIIMGLLLGLLNLIMPEHWDLLSQEEVVDYYIYTYGFGSLLVIFKDSIAAQSPGKAFMNLYVAQVQEGLPRATPKQILIRNLFMILFPVEAFKMIFDSHYRRFGDHFAGTMVIDVQRPPVVRRFTLKVLASLFVVMGLYQIANYSTAIKVKKSLAYQTAVQAIQGDQAVREALGSVQEFGFWMDVTYSQDEEGNLIDLYTIEVKGSEATRKVQVALQRMENRQSGKIRVAQVSLLAAAPQAEHEDQETLDQPSQK